MREEPQIGDIDFRLEITEDIQSKMLRVLGDLVPGFNEAMGFKSREAGEAHHEQE